MRKVWSTAECMAIIDRACASPIASHGPKQARLTGIKTGEYERRVFNKEIPENANGIENPDLIGWEGGQPITLPDGRKLSVGFSGFRGTTDLEIVIKAIERVASQSR